MATFQERVQDYVGTVSDTTALTDWLTESARKHVDLTPMRIAERYSVPASITSDTLALANYRVLQVFIAATGQEARQIPAARAADCVDPDSIWYATSRDPVYYVALGNLYLRPAGMSLPVANVITIPTSVLYSASTITGYPLEMIEPLILDVASKAQIQAISGVISSALAAVTFTEQTVTAYGALDLATQTSALSTLFSSVSTVQGVALGYIGTNFDLELAEEKLRQLDRYLAEIQARLQEMQVLIAEYSAERQVELNIFSAKVQQEVARVQSVTGNAVQRLAAMGSVYQMIRALYYDSLKVLGVSIQEQKQ